MRPKTILTGLIGLWIAVSSGTGPQGAGATQPSAAADTLSNFERYRMERDQRFAQHVDERDRRMDEFRRKRNEDFAKLLGRPWQEATPEEPIPAPDDDKPVPPLVRKDKDPLPDISPEPLPYDEIIKFDVPTPQPKPIEPIVQVTPPKPVEPTVGFKIYGTPAKVRFDKSKALKLASVKPKDVANAWRELSGPQYNNLVYDCLNIRENLALCDWAYLQMLDAMSQAVCGANTNEATLLMAYVYCQSGYKMRLGDRNGRLYMLFASKHVIYEHHWFDVKGGTKLYAYRSPKLTSMNLQTCEYPNEQPMSLVIDRLPKLTLVTGSPRSRQSRSYPDMKITSTANKNMLSFYDSYPRSALGPNLVSQWGHYAQAPMPEYIQRQLYPQLRKSLAGCDKHKALNKLLNLIQTGFPYGYDSEIWGGDRAFFPEESLHYPSCDCEDRSILLTRLVRDLLGLRCLLVFYPGHLATAVELPEAITGDYLLYQGKRFYIADPTIIGTGAPVGRTMRGMDNTKAKVLLLD